ncbi:lactococcin 972 family bacteriocin [Paenibacillus zanthoxyli]|uniref:lactococcin 972 family bacteriocin n=1 Tax=Paenibacillus zanthoxyli TaxID=369399 RepID=UPI00046EED30|nr:lactococcin 972 family bacteriocin [Paenibacillus zanthoxyli]
MKKNKMIKNTFMAVGFASILTVSAGAPAWAASETEATSGSVKLTNNDVTAFGISPASSVSVGGGTWNYGTQIIGNQKHVWSVYEHSTLSHKASTILGPASHTSYWKYAGTPAKSELFGNTSYTGYAYWDTYK